MFEINEGLFLVDGDLKAWGGSKHGQVLRQIERDDFHNLNFDDEYSIFRLQQYIRHNNIDIKLVSVVAVPKGYVYEEGAKYYSEIGRTISIRAAQEKMKMIKQDQ